VTVVPRAEGLDPLDRDRAASLADEGGSSGAAVEGDELGLESHTGARVLWRAAALGLAAAIVLYLRRTR
jgi:hypothetical protein